MVHLFSRAQPTGCHMAVFASCGGRHMVARNAELTRGNRTVVAGEASGTRRCVIECCHPGREGRVASLTAC